MIEFPAAHSQVRTFTKASTEQPQGLFLFPEARCNKQNSGLESANQPLALGKSLNFSDPQFSHLLNRDDSNVIS